MLFRSIGFPDNTYQNTAFIPSNYVTTTDLSNNLATITANTGNIKFANSLIYSNTESEVITLKATSNGLNIVSRDSFVQMQFNSNTDTTAYDGANGSWMWMDSGGYYQENFDGANLTSGIYAYRSGTIGFISNNNTYNIQDNILTLPLGGSIVANGVAGNDGQVLTTNGSAVY